MGHYSHLNCSWEQSFSTYSNEQVGETPITDCQSVMEVEQKRAESGVTGLLLAIRTR